MQQTMVPPSSKMPEGETSELLAVVNALEDVVGTLLRTIATLEAIRNMLTTDRVEARRTTLLD